MESLRFESLHSHTTLSDGVMKHMDVLAAAEELGIGVIAFTDHDALPDDEVMKQLRDYDGPVGWTVGVELSSLVPAAVGGTEKGSVHILGLFVDLAHGDLVEFCRAAEAGRLARMQRYVEHLRGLGFTISEADVMSQVPGKAIASPHMVKALRLHPENEAVEARLKAEFEAAAEHDEKLAVQLQQTLEDGPNQWPYTLYMGSGAWKPAPQVKSDNLRSYEDTVQLIRQAGGVALAAHWYLEPDKMTGDDLEAVIAAGGLDGIEIEVENVINDRDLSAGAAQSRELVKRYGLLSTWGSDSHTRSDLEAFVKSHVAQDSIGQTATLLERVKPDLSWSRL
jgi:predicted metal-dependent phosphoesterase TrpH